MATFRKISWKTGGDFLIRTAKLLEQGIPLEAAISFLGITLPREKARFNAIITELQAGQEFSISLQKAAFPDFICAQIFYANRHGFFITTLRETGEHMLRKAEERKKLQKILQYPLILIVTLAVVFVLLRLFLLPKFELLFTQIRTVKNPTTSLLYFLLEKMPLLLLLVILLFSVLSSLIYCHYRQKSYLAKITFLAKIPLVASFVKAQHSQIFAREIGYLNKCGLSIHDILRIFTADHSPPFLAELARLLQQKLVEGRSLHLICQRYPFFEKELIYIIHHGENNGKLAEELIFYCKLSQASSIQRLERLFTYIQPGIFLIVGIFIITTYLAILFPMFSLVDQL